MFYKISFLTPTRKEILYLYPVTDKQELKKLCAYSVSQNQFFILAIAGLLLTLAWSIYRDIKIERQYTGDLRNRIVGARLQQKGISPYFYKWHSSDGVQYYDPQNFDQLKVSNITASPFLHQLLYPVAKLPQRTISKLWLLIEYVLLLLSTLIALALAKNYWQKASVLVMLICILFTSAWLNHIAAGQIYIIIPFLFLLFYYCLQQNKLSFAILGGLCAASLILLRPPTIIFLGGFLFLLKQYTPRYILSTVLTVGICLLLYFIPSQNRLYWSDYRASIKEQVKMHQALDPEKQDNEADPGFTSWEGWDKKNIAAAYQAFPYDSNQEHGNAFVIINAVLKTKTPVWALAIMAVLMGCSFIYILYRKKGNLSMLSLPQIALSAFTLYMLVDLFSPIHRFLYYGVQWLFPLFLVAAHFNKNYRWLYAGMLFALLLNSLPGITIPMLNSSGEYLLLLLTILFAFQYKAVYKTNHR